MSQGKCGLQTNVVVLSLVMEWSPSVPCPLPWTSPFQGTPAGLQLSPPGLRKLSCWHPEHREGWMCWRVCAFVKDPQPKADGGGL